MLLSSILIVCDFIFYAVDRLTSRTLARQATGKEDTLGYFGHFTLVGVQLKLTIAMLSA